MMEKHVKYEVKSDVMMKKLEICSTLTTRFTSLRVRVLDILSSRMRGCNQQVISGIRT